MFRLVALIAVIGCSDRTPIAAVQPRLASAPIDAAVPDAPVAAAPPAIPWTPIVASQNAAIAVVAVTEDGKTAVTSDRGGGMRLWPTLDGKREPIVVIASATPSYLTVVRDGSELVIGSADSAGQLDVIRLTAVGEPVSRTRLDLERSVLALRATPHGFLALRDDGAIIASDLHGVRLGSLSAGPGERIVTLASRRDHAIAIVTAATGVRARSIELTATAGWGAWSKPLAIDPSRVALAPDGKYIAAATRGHDRLLRVELATGRRTELYVASASDDPNPKLEPLGFVDDETLAFHTTSEVVWWRRGETKSSGGLFVGPVVVGDQRLVMGQFASLAIASWEKTRYLGYRQAIVNSMQPAGSGWTITDGSSVARVDDRFLTRQSFGVSDDTKGWGTIVLDASHVLRQVRSGLALIDLEHPDTVAQALGSVFGEQYEPATRLLVWQSGNGAAITRYNTKDHAIEVAALAPEYEELALLDPRANGGRVALAYTVLDSTVTVTEVKKLDPDGEPVVRLGKELRQFPVPRQFWDGGGTISSIEQVPRKRSHPSPDGALFADTGDGRVTLHDAAGTVRWTIPARGITDVMWSGNAELVAFGGGMARVDLATGTLEGRHCGWGFGLYETRIDTASLLGAELCEP